MPTNIILHYLKGNSIGLISFILTTAILASCVPFKELKDQSITPHKLEGQYKNLAPPKKPKKFSNQYLWQAITPSTAFKDSMLVVQLAINSKNKVVASLYRGNILLEKKVLKGRFKKNGCYYLRRTFFVIPFIPILWGYVNEQSRIYVIDNNLIWEVSSITGGGWLLISNGNIGNYDMEFKRAPHD